MNSFWILDEDDGRDAELQDAGRQPRRVLHPLRSTAP